MTSGWCSQARLSYGLRIHPAGFNETLEKVAVGSFLDQPVRSRTSSGTPLPVGEEQTPRARERSRPQGHPTSGFLTHTALVHASTNLQH